MCIECVHLFTCAYVCIFKYTIAFNCQHVNCQHVAHASSFRKYHNWETFAKVQRIASHCNTLQCIATRCNTPSLHDIHRNARCKTLQHATMHCTTLQHARMHCTTLQHATMHCNTLQHAHLACHSPKSLPARLTKKHKYTVDF